MEGRKKQCPHIQKLNTLDEVCWFNPNVTSLEEGLPHVELNSEDIHAECARLQRFAPYLMKALP
ncbi:hypothetical protein [Vibrio parahaemolyticus]|uniref:hypothetical protein n=1 Tax=Vibrio parahaemolyticus TaxID=670 RepID=UPI0005C19793|nr:hypothetical protein [Vibrio parahaemolyticus]KIV03257.1 hypothetical protein SZ09_20910 [Vibrio parahaemolyticus]